MLETQVYAIAPPQDSTKAAEYPRFTTAQVDATKALFLNTECKAEEGSDWMEAALGYLFGDSLAPLMRGGPTTFN
jgi:hypothetical protein